MNEEEYLTTFQSQSTLLRETLVQLTSNLFHNPEVSGKEVKSHDILCAFLAEQQFTVERSFGLPTAFRAWIDSSSSTANPSEKLNIVFICEYDALPELGHAAGKPLVSLAAVAAALLIKSVIHKQPKAMRVTLIGCPREEQGNGKATLLKEGAFDGTSFALLCSPNQANTSAPATCAQLTLRVTYEGKSAHATASPWEGVNALDAAIACYSNIGLLRQQLRPSQLVSATITKGGILPNVVPHTAEMDIWLRAADLAELYLLKQRVTQCVDGAAQACGCHVRIGFDGHQVLPVLQNPVLAELYTKFATKLGFRLACSPNSEEKGVQEAVEPSKLSPVGQFIGSSDFGNISVRYPCLLSSFAVASNISKNTEMFAEECQKQSSYDTAIRAGQVMAMICVAVAFDATHYIANIWNAYKEQENAGVRPVKR